MSLLYYFHSFFFLSVDINKYTATTKPIQTRAKTPINMVPFVQETSGKLFNIAIDFYASNFLCICQIKRSEERRVGKECRSRL